MMFTREHSAAKQLIDARIGISARDENSFTLPRVIVLPAHGYSMRSILAVHAEGRGKPRGSYFFEPDQADSGDRKAVV
jgi:hypothetical protein